MDLEKLRSALDYNKDTGVFTWKTNRSKIKAGDIAGCINRKGYRYIGFEGMLYRANRLAWVYVYGTNPTGQIDHIDGNRLNDSIRNLRDVSASENQRNRKRGNHNSTSKYIGVSMQKSSNRWIAQISIGRKTKYLGTFDTELEAHQAYLAEKRSICSLPE